MPIGGPSRTPIDRMVLVAATAVQNAVHRMHLGAAPPSTLMTGTTTQIMLDVADRIYPPKTTAGQPGSRLLQMSTNVVVFALGCGAAALLYARVGAWCFVVPPLVSALSLALAIRRNGRELRARRL